MINSVKNAPPNKFKQANSSLCGNSSQINLFMQGSIKVWDA